MTSTIGQAVSTFGKYADRGANFVFGTGSTTIGDEIRRAVKARNRMGRSDSFVRSVANGFAKGVKKDNAKLAKAGFLKTTINTLKSIPSEMGAGFKAGKGLGKIGKFLKPLGKALPVAMNVLWIAGSLPNIIERTKDEGIIGGLKETGKTVLKMGSFALGGALGGAFGGFGAFIGGMVLSTAADYLLGEDYTVKKERLAEEAKNAQQNANPVNYDPSRATNPFERFNAVV